MSAGLVAPVTDAPTPPAADAPTVSVVIPLYQGERWIRTAIDSVLAQRGFDDLEIVVVDDGSTDAGADAVRAIADDRIRVIRQPNRGIAAARNEGIAKSRGRFIAFLDQDDLWQPDKLATQIPMFGDAPDVGLVHCQAARVDSHGRQIHSGPRVNPDRMRGDVRADMLVMNIVPGTAGVVVRRECFDVLGGFDEALSGADDWDMWSRIAGRWAFRYAEAPLCCLRLHEHNTSLDVEHMRTVSAAVRDRLFANPDMRRGFSTRTLRRLRRRSDARIHHYCATWLLRAGRRTDARRELSAALRLHPTRLRHIVLWTYAVIGWLPGPLRRRLI